MKTNRVRKDSKAAITPRQLKVPPQLPDLYRRTIADSVIDHRLHLVMEREAGRDLFYVERVREYHSYSGRWKAFDRVSPSSMKVRKITTTRRVSRPAAIRWIVEHVIPEEVQHYFSKFTKGGAR